LQDLIDKIIRLVGFIAALLYFYKASSEVKSEIYIWPIVVMYVFLCSKRPTHAIAKFLELAGSRWKRDTR
jgi:hypothetical protein